MAGPNHLRTERLIIGTNSVQIVRENTSRQTILVQNLGENNVYVHFGSEDATTQNGHLIFPNGSIEAFRSGWGPVHMISESGNNPVIVTEG